MISFKITVGFNKNVNEEEYGRKRGSRERKLMKRDGQEEKMEGKD